MNYLGPLYGLLAFGIFATHDVVIKYLGGTYSPVQIIFFATLFSFPLITLMLMQDKTEGNLRPVHTWWMVGRTISGVMTGLSAFYAFTVLPLAQVYVMLFAAPLLITILAIPVLGEKVGVQRIGAVLVGLAGVFVVLRPGNVDFGLGHIAGLSAAIFSALTSVIVRRIGRDERTAVLMLYPMVANFIVMASILTFVYKPMPLLHLGAVSVLSLLGFSAGLFLIAAYRHGHAAIVAPMQYSQIIWAVGFGYFLFDESPDQTTLIGAAIIIASGLYIVARESKLGDASTTPVLRTRSRGISASSFRISPILRRKQKTKKS